MTDSVKHERREHFRGKARPGRRIALHYRLAHPDDAEIVEAHTLNIGVGGAFIASDSPPAIGTGLVVILEVPTTDLPIEIDAEVRWTTDGGSEPRSAGMGVKFGALDVEHLLMLSDYFASLTGTETETDAGSHLP